MAVDKELTQFINKALSDDLTVPAPKPQKRPKRFIKSWRWVDQPKSKRRGKR